MRTPFLSAAILASATTLASAQVAEAPPPAPYKKVSELVQLPDFLPGIGQLFVDPSTLPEGPFVAYDHEGRLVSTIYMIPLDQLGGGHHIEDLAAPGGAVDHVDIEYNGGHPGVAVPHTHIVLWHVPVADESRVAQ
jgi:hypothetical protein